MHGNRFASTLVLFLVAPGACLALTQRTFVSAKSGIDTNPCTIVAPCRAFAAAISAVNPGGEVIVLDSGGYGPFVVTKSVTIQSPSGVYAGITATAGPGISVNVADYDLVTLRGLTINGGTNAIDMTSGGTIHVENVVIGGADVAVRIGGGANLSLTNSTLKDCATGVFVEAPAGNVTLAIDNTQFVGVYDRGIKIYQDKGYSISGSLTRSTLTPNYVGMEVVLIVNTGSPTLDINIDSSVFGGTPGTINGAGLYISRSVGTIAAAVRISNSTVSKYDFGLVGVGGTLALSRGNNTIRGNKTCDICAGGGSYAPN